MIKLTDLKKAIGDILKSALPTIPLYAGDVKEGFKRPSLFTKFDQMYRTDYKDSFLREITVLINYFPNDRNNYELEILEVQESIESAFKDGFTVLGRHIHIADDVESEIIDGILHMYFDLSYHDTEAGEPVPFVPMEELDING